MTDQIDFTAGGPDDPWLPVRYAIERTRSRLRRDAVPAASVSDLRGALAVVLDQVGQLVDAAERNPDAEWLWQRARAAEWIVTALAERIDRPAS